MVPRLHYIANHRGEASAARALQLVEAALEGGVPAVQLRSKQCSDADRWEMACRVVAMCHEAGAVCVIDDRVDLALACGADGVHVGPDDLPAMDARRILGPGLLLGASARTPERARRLEAAGVDYLGVGPCYLTASKEDLPDPIGLDGLREVAEGTGLPVVAIGGVTAVDVPDLRRAGAHGVAVIGAIANAPDPAAAVKEFMAQIERGP